jgi:4-hydroxy-tetrahydrodipicolinate synthase
MSKNNLLPIQGVWTALATPFKDDLSIDWNAFERLLELQANAGITGVVISGTTGESATLSVPEKLSLIRRARAKLPGYVRIMAGCGDSNTHQSVELSRLSEDAGADSLLIVTPPYNKPSTAGLVLHYSTIGNSTKLPICLYHVPSRTAQFLSIDALKTICAQAPIAAIKEASGDIGYLSRAVREVKQSILSGDDITFLPSLSVGGHGVISVITNIFPEAMVKVFKAFHSGQNNISIEIHKTLLPAIDSLFCEVNPCPLKAALKILGIAEPHLRLPLTQVSQENYLKIEKTIVEVKRQLSAHVDSLASA